MTEGGSIKSTIKQSVKKCNLRATTGSRLSGYSHIEIMQAEVMKKF